MLARVLCKVNKLRRLFGKLHRRVNNGRRFAHEGYNGAVVAFVA